MLHRTILLGAAAVLVVASLASAQEQKRSQGRGGFSGSRGGSAELVGMAEVQKELAISDDQKGLIEDMQKDLRQQLFGNSNPADFRNLSTEERDKRREEFRKKSDEVSKKADEMVSMILDPKQLDRLNQLRVQRESAASLGRAEVAEKVGLSQDQRSKVRKILDDLETANLGLFRNMRDLPREEQRQVFTKQREQREKADAEILGTLTAEQKERWQKMQGKKFDFPQRGFGGDAGGGSPRGQGPGETPKKSAE